MVGRRGNCGTQHTVICWMLRYEAGWPLSAPDLMISALGTCRLSWRLKIFFQHQLSGGEIKQIIWQAVYIFRSIRWGERLPPGRRAVDQSELSWDNPSCQSETGAAWWEPATAGIIFWISFSSQHSSLRCLAWEISLTPTLSEYIGQCSECSSDSDQSPQHMLKVFIKYCPDEIKSGCSNFVGSLF